MDEVETSFLETQEMKPLVWFRYIDDLFSIRTHGQKKLDSFLEELNRCNSSLKFTYDSSKTSIPFLGLKMSLSNGDISTDLHIKSTDRHKFLHHTSSHPDHTKRSIIYSQALRISRICSNKSDFLKHLESMKSWFEVRGYPNKLIEQEIEKVKFFRNGNVLRQRDPRKGVPFVLTYHPLFKSMGKIINKNLYLLYMNNEVKKVFTPKPMISFRSAKKMSCYLVRAKLYPEERSKGSFKCGSKRCEVCLNVNETSTFASTVTGETYIINHKFNCNDKCLVYLLTCNCCKKQYVGQTVDEFRFRWNNYKSNCRKHQRDETCMQQHLYEHFCSSNHNCFMSDVPVTFIDKTDSFGNLKREDY